MSEFDYDTIVGHAPTLTDFLLARIADDEFLIEQGKRVIPGEIVARLLAECEAKRRIVEIHSDGHECPEGPMAGWFGPDVPGNCPTLEVVALPYADHPDYREEWKP